MTAIHLAADNTFGVLDRYAALPLRHFDDDNDHQKCNNGKEKGLENIDCTSLYVLVNRHNAIREPGNDTGKDDKRNPIANTTGCNLIAKPHEEARASSQDDGNHENHGPAVIHQCVVDLEGITHGKSLDETEDNRAPACYFLDFITAILIVLGPLLKGRHHRG